MSWVKRASVFIDLETLGKWDPSVILSLGITVLKDEDIKIKTLDYSSMLERSREVKFDVMEQVTKYKRTIDKPVMDWWKGQGEEASRVLKASPSDVSISKAFEFIERVLREYGLGWKEVRIFDRNAFDMKKLQHVWEVSLDLGNKPAWDYQEVWGIETLLKFNSAEASRYGFVTPKEFNHPSFVYHSASCDAALDALRYYVLFQGDIP